MIIYTFNEVQILTKSRYVDQLFLPDEKDAATRMVPLNGPIVLNHLLIIYLLTIKPKVSCSSCV